MLCVRVVAFVPAFGIVSDVLSFLCQFCGITDDVIVKVALPYEAVPVHIMRFDMSEPDDCRDRFVCANDLPKRRNFFISSGYIEMKDTMNVIGHDDKLIQCNMGETFGQSIPGGLEYRP